MDTGFEAGGSGVPADPKRRVVTNSDRGVRGRSRTVLKRHKTTTSKSDPFSFDGVKIADGPLDLRSGRGVRMWKVKGWSERDRSGGRVQRGEGNSAHEPGAEIRRRQGPLSPAHLTAAGCST